MYDLIRKQLEAAVPFASYVGVEISEVGAGTATASLAPRPELLNHIGTLHAGALYTLGEAASGAAMTGAFASEILNLRPVAAQASIRYIKIAKMPVQARAKVTESVEELRRRLSTDGKVRFSIKVEVADVDGTSIAAMDVDWHVSRRD